jgi:hypothetical protein
MVRVNEYQGFCHGYLHLRFGALTLNVDTTFLTTFVLRSHWHSEGCANAVKRILGKVEGACQTQIQDKCIATSHGEFQSYDFKPYNRCQRHPDECRGEDSCSNSFGFCFKARHVGKTAKGTSSRDTMQMN